MELEPQLPAASEHPTYKLFAPEEYPLVEQETELVPEQAVPLLPSGAEPIRHLQDVTPIASLAVAVTEKESADILDGFEEVIVTDGGVASPESKPIKGRPPASVLGGVDV